MVQTLKMLAINMDNKGDDEPDNQKQAIYHFNYPKLKEAIQAEYNFLIKNKIWKLIPTPKNRQIITDWWCFNLKKDHNGHILESKAKWIAYGFKQKEVINFV